MPGSVVNLSRRHVRVPDPIVVDTTIIVEYLLASFLAPRPVAIGVARFFQQLIATNGTGIVTPTVFTEFVHVAVRGKYKHELRFLTPIERQSKYQSSVSSWVDLYKQDASILQGFLPDLRRLRNLLIANGLLFVSPEDLGPIPSGRRYDEELIDLIGTYGLDSSDAAILIEARRCGLSDIISLDADLQRAQEDFTIYTWL